MTADWQAAVDIGGTFTDILIVDRASGAFALEKAGEALVCLDQRAATGKVVLTP